MKAFTQHTGQLVAIDRPNIDTDQIIPKQFLKRIERSGFGQFLFYDWRFDQDGNELPDFLLNRPEYANSSVLLARQNFGSGSSREHAPWALEDYGFRVVIAPSFADIFFNNCFKNGILPIRLPDSDIDELFARFAQHRPYSVTADLNSCTLQDEHGLNLSFEVDEFRRHNLLNGLDDIGLTLEHEEKISAFEAARESAA